MAEEKPSKSQKVEGRILLDLRAKINGLERELARTKNELRETREELAEVNKKLSGREKSLAKYQKSSHLPKKI